MSHLKIQFLNPLLGLNTLALFLVKFKETIAHCTLKIDDIPGTAVEMYFGST
jgi:hypothetical protein